MKKDDLTFFQRTFISLALTVYGITMASHFYMHNLVLLFSETIVIALLIMYRANSTTYWMVPIAMVVSVIGDLLAYHFKAWSYANPTFAIGTPIWLPMGWAIMLILFDDLAETIFEWMKAKMSPRTLSIIINILRGLILVYAWIALHSINKTYALLFLLLAIPVFIFIRGPYNVILFIVAAVHGTAFEYFCIQNGAWKYTYPYFDKYGIPISLPLGWGLIGNIIWVCARAIGNFFERRAGDKILRTG